MSRWSHLIDNLRGGQGSGPPGAIGPQPPAAELGLTLLALLSRERPETNTIISPVSVGSVLAMAAQGARGSLRDSIMRVLGGSEDPGRAYADLLRQITNREGVSLLLSNSIWANQDFRLRPEYVKVCRESFDAEAVSVDFGDPATAARINSWVRERTRGNIGGILESTDPSDAVVLLNAAYFFGRWAEEFDPNCTRDLPFHAPSGSHPHPMMTQGGSFLYREGPGFQAVQLPYARDNAAMRIYLPARYRSLARLIDHFRKEPGECMRGFSFKDGRVTLPRFRSKCDLRLNGALRAAGLGDLFDLGSCDLSDMFLDDVQAYVSYVRHKVLVDVNEKGTEAAAATAINMPTAAPLPPKPFHLIFDRPFLFMIRDGGTGALLFAGAIYDPAQ